MKSWLQRTIPYIFFKSLNKLTKRTYRTSNIKNKTGRLLTETADIKRRWKEFAEDLYRKTDHSGNPDFLIAPDILRAEVEYAVHHLPTTKPREETTSQQSYWKPRAQQGSTNYGWTLCNKIWQTGQWPVTVYWASSVFIAIPKKGDLSNCDNHRTTALISHTSKIYLSIILKRMEGKLDMEISEDQAGFRKCGGAKWSDIQPPVATSKEVCNKHTNLYSIHKGIRFSKSPKVVSDTTEDVLSSPHRCDNSGPIHVTQSSRTSWGKFHKMVHSRQRGTSGMHPVSITLQHILRNDNAYRNGELPSGCQHRWPLYNVYPISVMLMMSLWSQRIKTAFKTCFWRSAT